MGQFFLDLVAFGLQHVDPQIQGRGVLQVFGQGPKIVPQLGLQGLRHPFGQVVTVRCHQGVGRNGIAAGQPLLFCIAQGGSQIIARTKETQNRQFAFFGAGT